MVLSGSEMNFVETLLTALGRPDLIDACRTWGASQVPVKRFLEEAFATKTRDEWVRWMDDKRVCFAPVLDLKEAWDSGLVRSRGMVQKGADGVENLGTPILFRDEPGKPSHECATPGQHTDQILERLGHDAAARAKLKAAKVC